MELTKILGLRSLVKRAPDFRYDNSIWCIRYFVKDEVTLRLLIKELLVLFVNTCAVMELKNS